MAKLVLADVWKRYGPVEAVRDLNLACDDGRMLALLGPSGCGKSSTLKMIAGIESISAGEIYFDERPVSRLAPGERNIAMVFEDYALYPHLTVFENIAFPLRVRHAPKAEVTASVEQAIDLLSLQSIRDQNVKSLSGGAQQRVSIGRALVREPDLLLFDEPLSHLDADQKVMLRTEIKRLQQTSGLTSILVTHDQTEAISMADRIAVMDHGRLQQVGSPHDLYYHPANLFVAGFIGEPPMNLLPAEAKSLADGLELVGAGWRTKLGRRTTTEIAGNMQSKNLILGIRPEHVSVHQGDQEKANGDLHASVFFREPRGDVDVMLFKADGGAVGNGAASSPAEITVIAELPGPTALRDREAVSLAFPTDKIALFDRESGMNLRAS